MPEALILSGARTAFATWASGTRGDGTKGGALKPHDPQELGAHALKGALERAGASSAELDLLVFANMYHVGPHACYGGRYVGWKAGVPPETPSYAVNLACGSGLQALIMAAGEVERGADLVASVGADNVSLVRRDVFVPSFTDLSCGLPIAKTAQDLASARGIAREELDRYARSSHERARAARERGVFKAEILPIGDIDRDDAILEKPADEHFAQSKLLFEGGSSTHANTHAIVDGASALVLARTAGRAGALGRYLGGVVVGVRPEAMGVASAAAIRALLPKVGLSLNDVDLFEINETFASQTLLCLRELGLEENRVNVNGGALALGHPFAATGGRLVLTLLLELRRRGARRGVASICVGGGLGVAVAVETAR